MCVWKLIDNAIDQWQLSPDLYTPFLNLHLFEYDMKMIFAVTPTHYFWYHPIWKLQLLLHATKTTCRIHYHLGPPCQDNLEHTFTFITKYTVKLCFRVWRFYYALNKNGTFYGNTSLKMAVFNIIAPRKSQGHVILRRTYFWHNINSPNKMVIRKELSLWFERMDST